MKVCNKTVALKITKMTELEQPVSPFKEIENEIRALRKDFCGGDKGVENLKDILHVVRHPINVFSTPLPGRKDMIKMGKVFTEFANWVEKCESEYTSLTKVKSDKFVLSKIDDTLGHFLGLDKLRIPGVTGHIPHNVVCQKTVLSLVHNFIAKECRGNGKVCTISIDGTDEFANTFWNDLCKQGSGPKIVQEYDAYNDYGQVVKQKVETESAVINQNEDGTLFQNEFQINKFMTIFKDHYEKNVDPHTGKSQNVKLPEEGNEDTYKNMKIIHDFFKNTITPVRKAYNDALALYNQRIGANAGIVNVNATASIDQARDNLNTKRDAYAALLEQIGMDHKLKTF